MISAYEELQHIIDNTQIIQQKTLNFALSFQV